MNRLARQTIADAGGAVLGERYLPIGSTDVGRLVAEIEATGPDFILNSLIGQSQYEFLRALERLGHRKPELASDRCPVLSCNVTECELPAMGTAGEGLIAAGPWFRGAKGWPGGERTFGSSHEAACYAAVRELARLVAHRPGSEMMGLNTLLAGERGVAGVIDPQTHHTSLPVLIARVEGGSFRTLAAWDAVAGDPYLTRGLGRNLAAAPQLRVVT